MPGAVPEAIRPTQAPRTQLCPAAGRTLHAAPACPPEDADGLHELPAAAEDALVQSGFADALLLWCHRVQRRRCVAIRRQRLINASACWPQRHPRRALCASR
jgi:hypothetical protein